MITPLPAPSSFYPKGLLSLLHWHAMLARLAPPQAPVHPQSWGGKGGMSMWDRVSCGTRGCTTSPAIGSLSLLIQSKRTTNLPHTLAFYVFRDTFLLKLYNSCKFSCFLGRRWPCWNCYDRFLETLRPCHYFPSNPKDFQNISCFQ